MADTDGAGPGSRVTVNLSVPTYRLLKRLRGLMEWKLGNTVTMDNAVAFSTMVTNYNLAREIGGEKRSVEKYFEEEWGKLGKEQGFSAAEVEELVNDYQSIVVKGKPG